MDKFLALKQQCDAHEQLIRELRALVLPSGVTSIARAELFNDAADAIEAAATLIAEQARELKNLARVPHDGRRGSTKRKRGDRP